MPLRCVYRPRQQRQRLRELRDRLFLRRAGVPGVRRVYRPRQQRQRLRELWRRLRVPQRRTTELLGSSGLERRHKRVLVLRLTERCVCKLGRH